MSDLLTVLIAGIAQGVPTFVIASGLTLTYGVLGVLNFAHGAFFAIGAYVAASVVHGVGLGQFVVVTLLSGVVVAIVGLACDAAVFQRLYSAGPRASFLGAFALALLLEGLMSLVWGSDARTTSYPAGLDGHVTLGGAQVPTYDLAVIAVGLVMAVGLFVLLNRTSLGLRVRAVADDRSMAAALGVRARWVSTVVFVLGAFLAGIAGALTAPLTSVDSSLATAFLIPAFVVVIVGGLGSVQGALVAALLLGVLESALFRYVPELAGFSYYLVVAAVLMFLPHGLFGARSQKTQIAR